MTDRTPLPVACTLSEPELARLPEGVTLRYNAEQGTLALLGEFIQLESQCCPFLPFQLTAEPGGGPIWLELTGPPGTRDFLAYGIGDPGIV